MIDRILAGAKFQLNPAGMFKRAWLARRAGAGAALVVLALNLALCPDPALATRLPADLSGNLMAAFPGAKIRLDGVIMTSKGELFLPVLPAAPPSRKHARAQLQFAFPDAENADVLVYSNGWCFLHVLKKARANTVIDSRQLPEKIRKQILSCHFPSDLIVPENFLLQQSWKAIAGDTNVQVAGDDTPNLGQTPGQAGADADKIGSICLTSLNTGTITLLDGQSLAKIADFPTEGTPSSMAWAGGHLYITDQAKNRVLILDPSRKQFLGQIDLAARSAPKGISVLSNGRLLYVSESASNDVAVIETATNRILLRTKVASGPGRLSITPNGNFLLVLNVPSGLCTFMSTLNQKVLGSVKVGQVPTAVTITKNSRFAYVSNRLSNTVSVIDIAARQVVGAIATGASPTGLTLSADDGKLYVANAKENTIGIYDTGTRQKLSEIKLPNDVDFPYAISLMPDGKSLLVSSESTDTVASLDLSKMQFDKQSTIGHSSHDIIWIPVR